MSDPKLAQVWELTVDGRHHRVEVRGSVNRKVSWLVDGEQVAHKASGNDKVRLEAESDGAVMVRFSGLGAPRRATLFSPEEAKEALGMAGVGGVDLVPEPGSPAARHEEKALAHPGRYTALATLGGVATVVVPILVAALLAKLAFSLPLPDIPWPDLPRIPWPDLPDVPWPSIPWPDWSLPDWSLPGWVSAVLDKVKYVWPVVLAFVLARAELRRRKQQAELREQQRQDALAQDTPQDARTEDDD